MPRFYARMGCAVVLLGLLASGLSASDPAPVYHGKTLRAWIADLKDADAAMRLDAADELNEIGPPAKAAVPLLLRAASDQEDEIRLAVLNALIRIDPTAQGVLPVLLDAAKDRCPAMRLAAVRSLKERDPKTDGVLPTLVASTKDPCEDVRIAAISGLDRVGKSAIPCLSEALRDKSFVVRTSAAMALMRMDEAAPAVAPQFAAALKDVQLRRTVTNFSERFGAMSAALLLESLKEGNEDLRADAAMMVGGSDDSVLPVVVALLKDKDPKVRRLAADAFPWTGSPDAASVRELGKALHDEDANVRESAVDALYRLGSKAWPAAPDLARLITATRSDSQRTYAVLTLNSSGSEAIPYFLVFLKDQNNAVRIAALDNLPVRSSDAKPIVPLLIECLADNDAKVRRTAIGALSKLSEVAKDATPALTRALEDFDVGTRRGAAWALRNIGPDAKQAAPALYKMVMQDADADCRRSAAVALSQIVKEGDPLLQGVVKDKTGHFDPILANDIVLQGRASAVPMSVWLEMLLSPESTLRDYAGTALASHKKAAVEPLRELLRSPNVDLRQAAARVLGQMPEDYVDVSVWLDSLQDTDFSVSLRAIWALARKETDAKVMAALTKALWEHPNKDIRRQLANGFLRHSTRVDLTDVCAVWKQQPAKERAFTLELLVAIGPGAHATLAEALADRDVAVRRAAADALLKGGVSHLPLLGPMLRDPDLRVRFAAWRALEKFSLYLWANSLVSYDTATRTREEALLTAALYAPDAESRMAALVVMGQARNGTYVRLVRRALKDPSVAVRRQAARALAQYPEHARAARLALTSALHDEDDVTRQLVEYALSRSGASEP